MKEIIVGVSGINAVDNPGPGVGVARSLKEDKELNVKIVGLAYDALEPGIYMDWVIDKSYIMPYPSGGLDPYMQRLMYIKESYGLDYVIPTLDVEMPIYSKYVDQLEDAGIKTLVPSQEQFKLRSKDRLPEVAKKIKIKVPRTRVITTMDGLEEALDELGYFVMIKGAFYKAYCAYNAQQARAYYHQIVAEWGYPVIVQEVVTGEEMNVIGVGDGKGGNLGLMGIKKMSTTCLGKMWTGVAIKNEKMLDASRAFIREYKWRGAFELECIVLGEDVFLIEINPRLPAWSYFATGVGINLPSNMVRKAFGLTMPPIPDYPAGKLYIRYTYEVVTDSLPFQEMITTGEHTSETTI